jgi:hypothetical protein
MDFTGYRTSASMSGAAHSCCTPAYFFCSDAIIDS